MKGVIQAGGMGTRLHPVTLEIPKPLLPVKRKPIIQYLVELFLRYGVKPIYVIVNTKDKEVFFKWKREYRNHDVTLVEEKDRFGTWGGIQQYLQDDLTETFIVSNGDELKEIDIGAMVRFHKQKKALATIAAVKVENPSDYGVLVSNKEGKVQEFLYKPKNPPTSFVMAGLYVAEPALFAFHYESESLMAEEDVFPRVMREGKLYEFNYDGRWFDCGTFERYERAIMHW